MKNDTLSIEIKNYLKELKEFGEYWFNQKKIFIAGLKVQIKNAIDF